MDGALFHHAPFASLLTDMDGRVMRLNARALDLFGLGPAGADAGWSFADAINRTERTLKSDIRTALTSGQFPVRVLNAETNERRPISFHVARIEQVGDPVPAILMVEDPSHRLDREFTSISRELERANRIALEERQRAQSASEHLKTVLDAATDAIVAIGPDRQVVIANAAARAVLGVGNTPTPFPWPAGIRFLNARQMRELSESFDPIEQAMSGSVIPPTERFVLYSSDGPSRYVRISSATVSDPSTPVKTVLVIDDVTQEERHRQRIERSARLDALGQLIGGIAHDFNNLLSTLLYSSELLRLEQLSERGQDFLSRSIQAIKRGAALTDRLLAFTSRQPGIAHARPVGEVLEELKEIGGAAIEETITLDIREPDENMFVFCDQSQLENALLNLVINSRDAIARSGVGDTITVAARPISELDAQFDEMPKLANSFAGEGRRSDHAADRARDDAKVQRYVEFFVTDNGPGMTDETKRRATDPFFTTNDDRTGRGLGLSIVYGFIQ